MTERLRSQCHSLGSFFYRFSVLHPAEYCEDGDPHSRIIAVTDSHLAQATVSDELDVLVDALHTRSCIISPQRLVSLAGKDGAAQVAADVQHIRNTVSINDILDRLRPHIPSGVFFREHNPCMPNTRLDILSNIYRWVNDLSLPNIAILHGYPGVGKSSIAQSLIEALAKSKQLGARLLCRREESTHHEVKSMWRLIAMELARMQPAFCAAISAQFAQEDPNHLDALSLAELFGAIIQHPMSALGPTTPLVVVIDALDEFGGLAGDQRRHAMLQSLNLWRDLPSTCRLFLTSRTLSDIQPLLDTNLNTVVPLEVGSRVSAQSEADLHHYYSNEFEYISKDYTSLPKPWPSLPDIDSLVRAADGLFIWASTVVTIIRQNPNKLKSIVAQVRDGSIAGSIDGLYKSLLDAAFPDDFDPEIFGRLTGAIIVARAPLTRGGLSQLLNLDEIEVEVVCKALQPVLETFPFLSFHHQSFVDFLVSDGCSRQFRCLVPAQHFNMTASCFSVMDKELHFNMGRTKTSYLRGQEAPELVKHVDEHVLYACQSWGTHLALCDTAVAVEDEIVHFLHSKLLFWLEVLSMSKCFGQASTMIINLASKAWVRPHISFNLSSLCQDVLSFLRTFAVPISRSYPHIYLSALPFTPKLSFIRRCFLKHFPGVMTIQSGLDERWPRLQATLRGHSEAVCSVAFSLDDKYIVSGSEDTTIRIWDVETQKQIGDPLCGHEDRVTSVIFSHDSKHIISGSRDQTVCIWDVNTQEQVGSALHGHQDWVSSVALTQDDKRIISSSFDGTIRIWDAQTNVLIGKPLRVNDSAIICVDISKDDTRIVSGSRDHSVRIWDALTQKPVGKPLWWHNQDVISVVFSPDSRLIASACNATIQIWDAENHQPIGKALRGHEDRVVCVEISQDGKRIASGSGDGTIRIWDVETRQLIGKPLCGHEGEVTSIVMSQNGKRLFSASDDSTICIWDTEAQELIGEPLRGPKGDVHAIALAPDGIHLLSGSDDGAIILWDTENPDGIVGEPLYSFRG
ncbi:quinon protein alcohol dehydrogenase-like superfamily [Flagelloscypha sp. PMI_526]|nr:quinon protein alcohol dehydrogenase-like superfamily [Flagelloscypha sp. PMI_526]